MSVSWLCFLWTLAGKKMGNWPKGKDACLHTRGWRRLRSNWWLDRICPSVLFYRRCRSCHWCNSGCRIWLAPSSVMDFTWWYLLWCCYWFWCTVCQCKKWRKVHGYVNWTVHRQNWKKAFLTVLLVIYPYCYCCIRRYGFWHFQWFCHWCCHRWDHKVYS